MIVRKNSGSTHDNNDDDDAKIFSLNGLHVFIFLWEDGYCCYYG